MNDVVTFLSMLLQNNNEVVSSYIEYMKIDILLTDNNKNKTYHDK